MLFSSGFSRLSIFALDTFQECTSTLLLRKATPRIAEEKKKRDKLNYVKQSTTKRTEHSALRNNECLLNVGRRQGGHWEATRRRETE